ncbi:MAG TPA: type II toxin-antitoxin system HicB family antitoxin [Ktedonobacterales bacterium]|nr:type II toxin-antitoxin system HicB family antitoxin [Ktedonobacterales bacterium]
MNDAPHYTIEIKWSDEDSRYVVILPEWADRYVMPVADGATYEEAVARGRNALENYIAFARQDGIPLPEPATYVSAPRQ